jgi:hypothetical protein
MDPWLEMLALTLLALPESGKAYNYREAEIEHARSCLPLLAASVRLLTFKISQSHRHRPIVDGSHRARRFSVLGSLLACLPLD